MLMDQRFNGVSVTLPMFQLEIKSYLLNGLQLSVEIFNASLFFQLYFFYVYELYFVHSYDIY